MRGGPPPLQALTPTPFVRHFGPEVADNTRVTLLRRRQGLP